MFEIENINPSCREMEWKQIHRKISFWREEFIAEPEQKIPCLWFLRCDDHEKRENDQEKHVNVKKALLFPLAGARKLNEMRKILVLMNFKWKNLAHIERRQSKGEIGEEKKDFRDE